VSKVYHAHVIDIAKNGDAILEFPDEMMKDLGWKEGDVLDFEVVGESLIFRNLTKEKNNEVTQGN
jgi:antitoxin component of MazEF toxin-antitoxin module